jgi:hypothetical protein
MLTPRDQCQSRRAGSFWIGRAVLVDASAATGEAQFSFSFS